MAEKPVRKLPMIGICSRVERSVQVRRTCKQSALSKEMAQMDLQKIVDLMNDSAMRERANYHLTLGAAIKALKDAPADMPVVFFDGLAPGRLRSYRGYYSDLAFGGHDGPTTAGDLLARCEAAVGETFEGYKGGDYVMTEKTPLWRSEYGESSGQAIVDAVPVDGRLVLITKQVD